MREPLISVIVPVYRTEAYIKRCVDSIRNQTYRNLEIILVDDGSPDRSGELCDIFAQEDPRVRVIHKENGGQSSARNCGLECMTGDYVAFVDSDDRIKPEMYETLMGLMTKYAADIVCCGMEYIGKNGHVRYFNNGLDDLLVMNSGEALGELLSNYRVTSSPCDKLFHRKVLHGQRMIEGMILEDFEVMHRWLHQAKTVVYTGQVFYEYFLSANSTLREAFSPRQFDAITASELRLDFYKKHSPENLDTARRMHTLTCLDILNRSANAAACKSLRRELAEKLKAFLKAYPAIPLPAHTKVEVFALSMGLPAFDIWMKIYGVYLRIRGLQDKNC